MMQTRLISIEADHLLPRYVQRQLQMKDVNKSRHCRVTCIIGVRGMCHGHSAVTACQCWAGGGRENFSGFSVRAKMKILKTHPLMRDAWFDDTEIQYTNDMHLRSCFLASFCRSFLNHLAMRAARAWGEEGGGIKGWLQQYLVIIRWYTLSAWYSNADVEAAFRFSCRISIAEAGSSICAAPGIRKSPYGSPRR